MITKYAKAKVNLTLDILGKRDDGYHEVEMIMQSIDLADIVTLEDAENIIVETDLAELADDRTNLAYRAAELLRDTYGKGRGAHIRIEKKIPLAAGLAGGSSDAAAVLLGLNELWKLGLDIDKLTALGARLGSDVPFCMIGGTMLAKGRGEVLARVSSLGEYPLVLVKPPLGVSTAAAYGGYRAENVETHPTADRMIRAIESGNITRVYEAMGNVLETVTIPLRPEIDEIKRALVEAGADKAMMSGSGPTVFAFAKSAEDAKCIADTMKQKYSTYTICTTATCQGEEI